MIINSNQIWLLNQKTQRMVPSMIGDPSVIWVTPTGPALTITWRWKTARWSASTCPSGTTIKTLTQDNRRLHPEMGNLIRPPMSGFLLQVNRDLFCVLKSFKRFMWIDVWNLHQGFVVGSLSRPQSPMEEKKNLSYLGNAWYRRVEYT